jgi:lipopolysaccharide biosynthesis glycosyltransferase
VISRWVDADSAVLNPALPLSIFLPPESLPEIHLLATKDQSGFNAGMFFIQVHEWSIKTLAQAMTYEWHKPDLDLSFLEQTSLFYELNSTANREHVLYQPRKWYNTYEFHHAYEGEKGYVMVHFPGLQEDRWVHMSKWLDILEGPKQAEWEVPLEETHYPKEIADFWLMLDTCKQTLARAKERMGNAGDHEDDLKAAIEKLETVLWSETDQMESMKLAAAEVHDILKATESG